MFTGKNGSAAPRSDPTPCATTKTRRAASGRPTTRTTGAVTGTSAPARWATWPATRRICRTARWNSTPRSPLVAKAGPINHETYPAWAIITYFFPARESKPAVALHWYEGARNGARVLPPAELLAKVLHPGETAADSGSLLIGTKGMLFSPNDYGAKFRLVPEKEFTGLQLSKPEKGPVGVGDRAEDPYQKKEWVEAIKAGKPALAASSFEFAGRLTETMLLGNIAVRFAGQKLEWDTATMKFRNSPQARPW